MSMFPTLRSSRLHLFTQKAEDLEVITYEELHTKCQEDSRKETFDVRLTPYSYM